MYSQCPPGIVQFDTQAEVDDFVSTYPNCDYLEELEISFTVTDLSGLSSITKLGYLYFSSTSALTSLAGFENLVEVEENLGFINNAVLNDLSGLRNLKKIGRDLRFEENTALDNLDGLCAIEVIGDDIELRDNPLLGNCCGIAEISAVIGGEVIITGNTGNCTNLNDIIQNCQGYVDAACLEEGNKDLTRAIKIDFFPNPATSYFTIQIKEQDDFSGIKIYDHNGKLVQSHAVDKLAIDVSGLISGMYFVELEFGIERIIKKLIVE